MHVYELADAPERKRERERERERERGLSFRPLPAWLDFYIISTNVGVYVSSSS
jgi:hypothetical protein